MTAIESDFITVLTTTENRLLAKHHTPAGVRDYGDAKWFTSRTVSIASLDDLAAALDCDPRSAVILGRIAEGIDPAKPHRRLLHPREGAPASYQDTAHGFAIADVDGPESDGLGWLDDINGTIERVVRDWLPREFRGVDVAWRLTSSAGIKPGVRMRLAFMLDRAVTTGELKGWFAGCPHIDHSVFSAVQLIYGDPVFEGVPDPVRANVMWPGRAGLYKGRQRPATPPHDLAERATKPRSYTADGSHLSALAPDGLVESADDPDLIAEIREQIAGAIQRDGVGETPTGARAFALVTWLLKLCVGGKIIEPEALQAILAEHWRDVADDLVENALAAIGDERGSVEIERMPEPDGRADTFDEAAEREFARERHMKAERALALILESRLPAAMKPDDVAQVEAFRAGLRKPANREVMLGSIEALIADLNKPRSRFGFGGCRPSEGKRAPPLTYFDEHKTLPKVPHEGCIGFMIGSRGNHKTGTLIKYGLDACDAGYRVLFIAAEDAHGIKKLRLPAAIEARGREEDHYDDLWITESASLVLRSREHREDLIATFRDFAPNLVFIDVLAKTIAGSDVNAAKDAGEIVAAMEEIAKGFGGATVLATRHPPLATDGRGTGSNEFVSLAYFQWLISAAGGIVTVHADKIKNGPDDFDVRYKIVEGGGRVPVIAEASVSDLAEAQRRTVRAVGPDPIVADVIAVLIPSTPPISMGALSQRLRDQFPDRYSVLAEGDITTRVKNEVWGGSHGKRDGSRGPAAGPLAPYATINGLGTKHAVYEFWHQR